MKKVCLITGGNRGIGLEISRGLGNKGYKIYLAARSKEVNQKALNELQAEGIDAIGISLDVSDPVSIKNAFTQISQKEQKLDVLVNNAGILHDSDLPPDEVDFELFHKTLLVNAIGPHLLIKEFLPLLNRSDDARIINMSSDLGAISQTSNPESRYDAIWAPSYRVSKTALNVVTLTFAKKFRNTQIKVCSCSPGWCHTDLDIRVDSSQAPNTAKDGADTPIWLATEAPAEQINGQFFYKRAVINW